MGVASLKDLYDGNGRFAAGRCYVYFLMAPNDGWMYVKIGRSYDPVERLGELQVGCPFRITKAAKVQCLSVKQSQKVEKALHKQFCPENTNGEWFRFAWNEGDARRELMTRIEFVLNAHLRSWRFEEIDVPKALRFLNALRSRKRIRPRKTKRN